MQVLCNLGKTSIRNFEKYVNNDLQVNSNKHMLYQPVCRFDPNATSPSAPQPGFEQICVSTLLGGAFGATRRVPAASLASRAFGS
jgi:hypothetical protein